MEKVRKIVAWVMMVGLCQGLYAETAAVPMLETVANQIIHTLKQNKEKLKADHSIIEHAVEQYLLPHVDVVGMSRSVLGRNAWAKATTEEKQEFTREFTHLVVRTYATPLAEYSGEEVVFSPKQEIASGKKFSRVNSVIHRTNGQHIALSYALVLKDGAWKIYDLSIEGVSLLQSFRNQFSSVLQKSSIQELLVQMKTHKKAH